MIMNAQSVIEVGLVGYGLAGRVFHAPLIDAVDGLRLHTIVQRRGDEAAERYPSAHIVRDFAALLEESEVSVVVIATPNESHFDLARRALLAGKHVVVDKPFTVTSAEARRLVDLAKEQQRVLTVFQNRRWEGDFRTIRGLIDQDRFGRVVYFEARFDRFRDKPKPNAWRETNSPGSGILYDLGSHLIDQTTLLFGRPDRVTADVRQERDFGASDDAFDIWLQYPRMRAALSAGMLVRERTPRFTVRGTAATFTKFGLDPQERALASGRTPREADWGREPREQWGVLITDSGEETIETLPGAYQMFYENLRDAIGGAAPLEVSPDDARLTMEIIEAAARSSRERRSIAL
jgi:scyllo-inositol 2-dehydrogenase (NADP+)